MSSRGCLLWDVIVYGSVYGVFQVVPVVFKWSGVGVGFEKLVSVGRHVLFDRVRVGSGVEQDWSSSAF